jgi:hypothetical protein
MRLLDAGFLYNRYRNDFVMVHAGGVFMNTEWWPKPNGAFVADGKGGYTKIDKLKESSKSILLEISTDPRGLTILTIKSTGIKAYFIKGEEIIIEEYI